MGSEPILTLFMIILPRWSDTRPRAHLATVHGGLSRGSGRAQKPTPRGGARRLLAGFTGLRPWRRCRPRGTGGRRDQHRRKGSEHAHTSAQGKLGHRRPGSKSPWKLGCGLKASPGRNTACTRWPRTGPSQRRKARGRNSVHSVGGDVLLPSLHATLPNVKERFGERLLM